MADGVGYVLDKSSQGGYWHAEVVEVFDDAGELEGEVAEVEDDEGGDACFGGNEGGYWNAADENEDTGELSQDAVDAALAGEFHLRIAPGGEAPEEKIEDHGDADEREDIQRLAFCGGDGLLEGVEKFLRDVHGVTFFLLTRVILCVMMELQEVGI